MGAIVSLASADYITCMHCVGVGSGGFNLLCVVILCFVSILLAHVLKFKKYFLLSMANVDHVSIHLALPT